MKPPCMLVTSQVLPALRAIVAKDLIEVHELKPAMVASKMGITPAAVTQYVSGVRGRGLVPVLQASDRVKQLLDRIVDEFLKTQSDQRVILNTVCALCKVVREERILCQLCDISVRDRESGQCSLCLSV